MTRNRERGVHDIGGFNAFDALNYSLIVLFCISIVYPFWHMLIVSLSSQAEASRTGLRIVPDRIDLSAYRSVFLRSRIGVGYLNSIFRAVVGTSLSLAVVFCAAYPLSKKELPFRNVITGGLVFTMFFNGGLIPTYLVVRSLGLIDSRAALILPLLANVFNIVIARNYIMSSIDPNLEQAAAIDGANHIYVLFRIIIPLCKPVIATVGLWTIVAHWNAWFDAMIYINSNNKEVLQVMLRKILIKAQLEDILLIQKVSGQGAESNPETLKAAFMFVAIGPIILAYPFLQRYFVKGIVVGSLKG